MSLSPTALSVSPSLSSREKEKETPSSIGISHSLLSSHHHSIIVSSSRSSTGTPTPILSSSHTVSHSSIHSIQYILFRLFPIHLIPINHNGYHDQNTINYSPKYLSLKRDWLFSNIANFHSILRIPYLIGSALSSANQSFSSSHLT